MDYPLGLLIVFIVLWVGLMARPADRKVWWTEGSFTIACVALLIFTHPRWPLSDASYTMIFLFLCLHTLGGHYTYAKVPYDRWAQKVLGRSLGDLFGLRRNHYDRLVHFCFGLLLAYPVHEVLVRHAEPRGAWSYPLAACVIVTASTLFELVEWAVAAVLGGDAGQDYLAAQGDEWDAHKDMALAALGAVVALGVTALL